MFKLPLGKHMFDQNGKQTRTRGKFSARIIGHFCTMIPGGILVGYSLKPETETGLMQYQKENCHSRELMEESWKVKVL